MGKEKEKRREENIHNNRIKREHETSRDDEVQVKARHKQAGKRFLPSPFLRLWWRWLLANPL